VCQLQLFIARISCHHVALAHWSMVRRARVYNCNFYGFCNQQVLCLFFKGRTSRDFEHDQKKRKKRRKKSLTKLCADQKKTMSQSQPPTTPSRTSFNVSALLTPKPPFTWLPCLRIVGTHTETLTAYDGAVFTGYMFEITCVVRRDPKTNEDNDNDNDEEEEDEDEDEAPMEQYVWCIARRYRQFEELRRSLQSTTLRKVQVPKKGWLWSTSTDVTLVNERLKVKKKKRNMKLSYLILSFFFIFFDLNK